MSGKRGNGEGSIRQRTDGRWEGIYTEGVKSDGSMKRRSVYGKTRAEVVEKLNQATGAIRKGAYIAPDKMTVSQWLDRWFEIYVKRPDAKLSTVWAYERVIEQRIKPYIGGYKIQKLQPAQVQKWLNQLSEKYAPASVKGSKTILTGALKQAVRDKIVLYDVSQSVINPKMKQKEKKPLSHEEEARFLEALPENDYGRALELILNTGLRVGECVVLKWSAIHDGALHVEETGQVVKNYGEGDHKTFFAVGSPKSDSSARAIPLNAAIQDILSRQRTAQAETALRIGLPRPEYVFTTSSFTPYLPAFLTHKTYDICDKIGIERRSVHELRHTFGTRLNERGVDANTIARIMGHSNPALTMNIYIHSDDEQAKKAMDLLCSET